MLVVRFLHRLWRKETFNSSETSCNNYGTTQHNTTQRFRIKLLNDSHSITLTCLKQTIKMLIVCRIFVETQLSWHTVVTQSHKDSVLGWFSGKRWLRSILQLKRQLKWIKATIVSRLLSKKDKRLWYVYNRPSLHYHHSGGNCGPYADSEQSWTKCLSEMTKSYRTVADSVILSNRVVSFWIKILLYRSRSKGIVKYQIAALWITVVLYCVVFSRIISYHIELNWIISYSVELNRIVSYSVGSYRIILNQIVSYCTELNHIVSHLIESYHFESNHIILSWIILYRIESNHIVLYRTLAGSVVLSNIELLLYESQSYYIVSYHSGFSDIIKYQIKSLIYELKLYRIIVD